MSMTAFIKLAQQQSLISKMDRENMLEISYFKDSSVLKFLSYKCENWDTAGNWIQQAVYDDNSKSVKSIQYTVAYDIEYSLSLSWNLYLQLIS